MHNFDWDDIRIFLQVIQSGSLTQAAQQLSINQSTVSRRISNLERQLGSQLFERSRGAGLVLTSAGEQVWQFAEPMNDNAHAIARGVLRNASELRGSVSITSTDVASQILTIPSFVACARRYPQLELNLLVSNDALDLGAREADIALRIAERPPDNAIATKVCSIGLCLYATKDWVEAYQQGRRDLPSIEFTHNHPQSKWQQQCLPDTSITYRTNSGSAEFHMTRMGLGVAQLGCILGDTAPELLRLPGFGIDRSHSLWVLSHTDLRTTARVRAVRDFIIERSKRYRALIRGYDAESDVEVPAELAAALAAIPPS